MEVFADEEVIVTDAQGNQYAMIKKKTSVANTSKNRPKFLRNKVTGQIVPALPEFLHKDHEDIMEPYEGEEAEGKVSKRKAQAKKAPATKAPSLVTPASPPEEKQSPVVDPVVSEKDKAGK